ncbi:MAG: MATE family efflux transporter [Oscillatoriophycideae cyanobacterium NC_groundwater_1537_Pr4_S-0.65um_50_18]|nr:MATE family efflux transporter [Oscillatoriophycideae cyanobacterium NC_groundwater_1537_Pr4_S-0.65um_50_18]
MVPLAGLVDTAFLGHLTEIRHFAGVVLATVLFNYIYWTFGFLRMATTGTTAQAVGRGDRPAILLIGLRNGLLAMAIGSLILLLQVPLRTLGFALVNATPEVKAAGQDYFDALIWAAPATLVNYVLIGWFLGRGQSGKVLLLSVVANGANVVLDYLLIVRLGWESAGAGWATAASQYLMLLVGMILVGREVQGREWRSLLPHLWDAAALKAAFLLNGEILVRTFALITTFALFTNLSSGLGTIVLSTNAALLQVVNLAAYFIDGLAFATESLAGVFHGRGSSDGLAQLLRVSGITCLGLGLFFAIAFLLFPTPLFSLLTSHSDLLDRFPAYVPWLFPVLGFGSIAYMLDGYFLGLTQGQILRRSTLISAAGFAPVAIVAWYFRSSHLLWLALSVFMATRAATLATQVPQTLKMPQE